MYILQLFDKDDAVQPRDVRLLRDGTLRIGRDAAADWSIADPECALSRAHCEVTAHADGLTLRALGTNGVFDGETGARLPDAVDTPLHVPGAVRMGRFRIVATRAPLPDPPADTGRPISLVAPIAWPSRAPADWADCAPANAATTGSLLEAFCDGAGLDSSLFSSEPPEEIMRRAGAVYRQMVLGVGDLMAERDRARGRYKLNRTTIRGHHDNPFKWAPTQRLAIDLLLTSSTGFLCGAEALKASFRDLKCHLVGTFAGLQGSLGAAVARFDPAAIDAVVASKASLLKSRASMQMAEVAERHADLVAQVEDAMPGSLDRAFVKAYDAAEWTSDRHKP
ncbi:type VI secretion system-associated FHA domain protein [Sphingomonas sp.]|jgi:predicted component of type VI protein secretion system|uniref:type VI secretion system-associated FHA domain protein n=1 Tax=Sphingomonas sp. TaxID=28214 RepID=UPI002EDB4110